MWCRPEPSSVSPIYMPGRLRTASSPLSTLMESAPYSSGVAAGSAGGVKEAPNQRETLGQDGLADRGKLPKGNGNFWPEFKGIPGCRQGPQLELEGGAVRAQWIDVVFDHFHAVLRGRMLAAGVPIALGQNGVTDFVQLEAFPVGLAHR